MELLLSTLKTSSSNYHGILDLQELFPRAIVPAVRLHLNLLALRGEMTQEWMAQKTGVSQDRVSKYERGATKPDLDSAVKIAHAFGLSLDELLFADLTGVDLSGRVRRLEDGNLNRGGSLVTPADRALREREAHYQRTIARLHKIALSLVNVIAGEESLLAGAEGPEPASPQAGSRGGHRKTGR